jgi:hypothetical protein
MLEIKEVVLKVLNQNKSIAKIHPAMTEQQVLDKAIEITEYWVKREVGLAIGEFYAANGIKLAF